MQSADVSAIRNKSQYLENKLGEVEAKQGIIGNVFNEIKEITGLGLSNADCQSALEAYNNNEISFEEAVKYINDFERKQDTASELIVNIATGVGAIAAATATAGASTIGIGLAMTCGAPVGAALKTGIKIFDRATNDIEDDALDIKQIAKDAVSGAATGATSAISSGVGKGIKDGNIGLSILNGGKCGIACGAASNVVGYMTDVALDDKEFDAKELVKGTAFSSFVSGTVGMGVGAGIYGIAGATGKVAENAADYSLNQTIVRDSIASSLRKALGQGEKNALQS